MYKYSFLEGEFLQFITVLRRQSTARKKQHFSISVFTHCSFSLSDLNVPGTGESTLGSIDLTEDDVYKVLVGLCSTSNSHFIRHFSSTMSVHFTYFAPQDVPKQVPSVPI